LETTEEMKTGRKNLPWQDKKRGTKGEEENEWRKRFEEGKRRKTRKGGGKGSKTQVV